MPFLRKIHSIPFFFILFSGLLMGNLFSFSHPFDQKFSFLALAEDDEDDEDNEKNDEENKTATSSTSSTPQTQKIIQNVTTYKPVTKTVIVTEEAYQKDTDGDELVDALDPDPLKHQSEYFTDIDGDGISNALDQHHDEDDFAYLEFETDENGNGIIDSYEQSQ